MADADHLTGWALRHYLGDSWAVVLASSVHDASGYLRHEHPVALVVSDNLLGGNVDELIEQALSLAPPIRVIKLIPYFETPAAQRDERIAIVEKPFDLKHLKSILDASLSS